MCEDFTRICMKHRAPRFAAPSNSSGGKRSLSDEDDGAEQQRCKVICLMPPPWAVPLCSPASAPAATDNRECSFEFPRPIAALSSASSGAPLEADVGPLVMASRRTSEISFEMQPYLHPVSRMASYQEAATADLTLHVDPIVKHPSSPVVPLALPVYPQPAPDPDSHVFKPEPMLHLNGQAMQHLSILKEMRAKVAQTLRHRISRRVATGRLSQQAADALLKTCLSRLAKPVSTALQRYCASKRYFAEGQACLSRITLTDGCGALGLFTKDVSVITDGLVNAIVKAAIQAEATFMEQQQLREQQQAEELQRQQNDDAAAAAAAGPAASAQELVRGGSLEVSVGMPEQYPMAAPEGNFRQIHQSISFSSPRTGSASAHAAVGTSKDVGGTVACTASLTPEAPAAVDTGSLSPAPSFSLQDAAAWLSPEALADNGGKERRPTLERQATFRSIAVEPGLKAGDAAPGVSKIPPARHPSTVSSCGPKADLKQQQHDTAAAEVSMCSDAVGEVGVDNGPMYGFSFATPTARQALQEVAVRLEAGMGSTDQEQGLGEAVAAVAVQSAACSVISCSYQPAAVASSAESPDPNGRSAGRPPAWREQAAQEVSAGASYLLNAAAAAAASESTPTGVMSAPLSPAVPSPFSPTTSNASFPGASQAAASKEVVVHTGDCADNAEAEAAPTLASAMAGVFMEGLEAVDWYGLVQNAYDLDPEELLMQQTGQDEEGEEEVQEEPQGSRRLGSGPAQKSYVEGRRISA